MAISERLNSYLHRQRAEFDLITHTHSASSAETAEAAHVSGDCLAKAVVVKKGGQYAMVVIPSSCRVDLDRLRDKFHHDVKLASEQELTTLFPDCGLGAIPPIGPAYGLETVWDSGLAEHSNVYFEAGDHQELVRVTVEQFTNLMGNAQKGCFGCGDEAKAVM